MPMKLNVGLNQKRGEPNYGSRGASFQVEVEIDSSVAIDPRRLRERARQRARPTHRHCCGARAAVRGGR